MFAFGETNPPEPQQKGYHLINGEVIQTFLIRAAQTKYQWQWHRAGFTLAMKIDECAQGRQVLLYFVSQKERL